MTALPTLALGTYTNVNDTAITGAEPVLQLIAGAVDTRYVNDATNSSHTGIARFALADMPADFGNMDTLSVRLRYALSATANSNTWDSLQARVFKSDGTTALTNVVTVVSGPITTTTITNSSVVAFTGLDTAATKAEWNAAVVHIRFNISKNKGGDSVEERVYAAELTGTYTLATATLAQAHFRGRSDAATVDTAPTWKAAEDAHWSQAAATNFRIRFAIQETAGVGSTAGTYTLQRNLNSAGWVAVTTSSAVVKAVDAGASADETAIATTRMTGTGSFVSGASVYDETGTLTTGAAITASNWAEFEFGVQIVSADVYNGHVIQFRVAAGTGTAISVYSKTPALSVTGASDAPTVSRMAVSHTASPWITIYNTADWSKVTNPSVLPGAQFGMKPAFSPNGSRLAVAHYDTPFVTIYNTFDWTKIANPGTLPASEGRGVAYSHDGSLLAVAHITTPFVTIYNTVDWTKVTNPGTLPGGTGNKVAFSFNGALMAVAHDSTPFVTVYNTSGWTKVTNPGTLPTGNGNGVAFSPNGALMAVAHNTTPFVTIYNTVDWTKVTNPGTLPTGGGLGVSFSPDGALMAVAHAITPFVTIYNTSDWTKVADPGTLPASTSNDSAFSSDGALLAIVHSDTPFVTIYNTVDWTKVTNPGTLPPDTGRGVHFTFLAAAAKSLIFRPHPFIPFLVR